MCGNRQAGGMKRDTRRRSLMPLAPAHGICKCPKAPAGRHVYSARDMQMP